MTQKNQYAPEGQKHIAIFGCTRGVGLQAVTMALEAGHSVTVLVRDPENFSMQHPMLTTIQGDATNSEDVRKVVKGCDSVICALGAPALSKSRVRTKGTRNIVDAMKAEGVRRLIAISLIGARESRASLPFVLKYLIFPLYLNRAAAEHDAQEEIIEASGLDWTVVRPPNLTDGPVTGNYAHGFRDDLSGLSLKISRADVADMMLRQLSQQDYLKRTVAVSYRV